ncbi:MAG: hypothetical protein ACLP01_14085 [Solirubrobacteraceae bacterium]
MERIQPEAELVLLGLQPVWRLLGRRDTANPKAIMTGPASGSV